MSFAELESTGIGLDQKPLGLKKINNVYRNISAIEELLILKASDLTPNKWNNFKLNQSFSYDIILQCLFLKNKPESLDLIDIQILDEANNIYIELSINTDEIPYKITDLVVKNNYKIAIKPASQTLSLILIGQFCIGHDFTIEKIGETE